MYIIQQKENHAIEMTPKPLFEFESENESQMTNSRSYRWRGQLQIWEKKL